MEEYRYLMRTIATQVKQWQLEHGVAPTLLLCSEDFKLRLLSCAVIAQVLNPTQAARCVEMFGLTLVAIYDDRLLAGRSFVLGFSA